MPCCEYNSTNIWTRFASAKMSNEKHQTSHPADSSQDKVPLKSEVNFKINSDSRLSSAERSELVVTLPRYSPASDVTAALDPEPTDPETSCRALDSPSDRTMALFEETGRNSSLHSERSDLTQNLVNLCYYYYFFHKIQSYDPLGT